LIGGNAGKKRGREEIFFFLKKIDWLVQLLGREQNPSSSNFYSPPILKGFGERRKGI